MEFLYNKTYPYYIDNGETIVSSQPIEKFSSFSPKFFYQKEGRIYFLLKEAVIDSLLRKQEKDTSFLFSIAPDILTRDEIISHILTPLGKRINKEQVKFVVNNYPPEYLHLGAKFIENLADYGDIEYFEEVIERNRLTDKIYRVHFLHYTVEHGYDNLLEVYEKYKNGVEQFHPETYHPDHQLLPPHTINRNYLSLLEALDDYEKLYKALLTIWDRTHRLDDRCFDLVFTCHDFIRWLIKNHPQDLTKFGIIDTHYATYDIYKHLGTKPENINMLHIRSAFSSGDTWETIDKTLKCSDEDLNKVLYRAFDYMLYNRTHELLAWDRERTIKALKYLASKSYFTTVDDFLKII